MGLGIEAEAIAKPGNQNIQIDRRERWVESSQIKSLNHTIGRVCGKNKTNQIKAGLKAKAASFRIGRTL